MSDPFIEVDAPTEFEAQNAAFALFVARLKPDDFVVWPTNDKDDWRAQEWTR